MSQAKPRYQQLKDLIIGRISSGDLQPRDRVPSENELVESMSVSRMTANRALRELNDEGYVERIAGSARALYLGPMDEVRRWTFLRAIDALVLTPRFGENYGNVVVEAIASGTPALVSDAVGCQAFLGPERVTCVTPETLAERFRSSRVPAPPAPADSDPETKSKVLAPLPAAPFAADVAPPAPPVPMVTASVAAMLLAASTDLT